MQLNPIKMENHLESEIENEMEVGIAGKPVSRNWFLLAVVRAHRPKSETEMPAA